jgi:hypothetical protein
VRSLKKWVARAERRAGPEISGFLGGFGIAAGIAALGAFSCLRSGLQVPSPELFQAIAGVGVGLLIAFGVTLSAVDLRPDSSDDLNWLGYGCGMSFAGFVGVAGAVALSAADSPPRWLALIALAWDGTSLFMVGALVTLGPLLVLRSRRV